MRPTVKDGPDPLRRLDRIIANVPGLAPQQLWKVLRSLRNSKHRQPSLVDPVSQQTPLAPRDWEPGTGTPVPEGIPAAIVS